MDLLPNLLSLGFTEYEAKVYLALLRNHPATGYQLSKAAGVPRSMVYEALGRLDSRGAVLKTDEARATLYRPLPPEVLIDRVEQEHRLRVDILRAGLKDLYSQKDEGHLWSITGRRSVLAYATRMLQGARQEALLVLSDPDLEALRGEIQAANGRGAAISALLSGKGELDCGQVAHHSPLESEIQDLTRILVVVVDNQEALIASTDLEMSATITRSRNLVLIARQFIWMELFTQRVYSRLSPAQLMRLEPQDRQFFQSLFSQERPNLPER